MDELQIGWKSGWNVTEPMCYFCISDTFRRTTFHPLNLILSRIFPIWKFCKYLLNCRTLLYMLCCTQSSWGQRGKGKENGKNELKPILNYLVVEFSKTPMITSTWAIHLRCPWLPRPGFTVFHCLHRIQGVLMPGCMAFLGLWLMTGTPPWAKIVDNLGDR